MDNKELENELSKIRQEISELTICMSDAHIGALTIF